MKLTGKRATSVVAGLWGEPVVSTQCADLWRVAIGSYSIYYNRDPRSSPARACTNLGRCPPCRGWGPCQ